jgi:hypothetical protein
MAAVVRFCDARLKSGRASASALALASMLAPSLARRSLLRVGPRSGGVGARARGCLAAERHSWRSPFPSRGYSCTGTSASSSSGWCLASASSSSRARRCASAAWWHGAGSGSELLDAEATQTLHSHVGLHYHVVRAPRVVVDLGAVPFSRKLLT